MLRPLIDGARGPVARGGEKGPIGRREDLEEVAGILRLKGPPVENFSDLREKGGVGWGRGHGTEVRSLMANLVTFIFL